MNIGIDLDGVVYDSEVMLKCSAEFYDQQIGGNGIVDNNAVFCQKRYNWTKEQEDDFLAKNLITILKTAPLKYMAKTSLEMLRKAGHKLFAISSRGNVLDEEVKITKKRIKKDKLNFDEVILYATDKAKICKDLNIDIMIDDMHTNIINLANNNIKCLYFRNFVFNPITDKNVIEVHNWGEIIRQINSINK